MLQLTTDVPCKVIKDDVVVAYLQPGSSVSFELTAGRNRFKVSSIRYPFISVVKNYEVNSENEDTVLIDFIKIKGKEKIVNYILGFLNSIISVINRIYTSTRNFVKQCLLFLYNPNIKQSCLINTICKFYKIFSVLILLFTIALVGKYIWDNRFVIFNIPLKTRLGYAEVGNAIDGYRLVKTYTGKFGYIQEEEPWLLCTDTIYSEYLEMNDSVSWLKQQNDNSWKCFYAGKIRDISNYTQIINDYKGDVSAFVFNKEILHLTFLSADEYNRLKTSKTEIEKHQNKEHFYNHKGFNDRDEQKKKLEDIDKCLATCSNVKIPNISDTLKIDSLGMKYGFINKNGQIIVPPVLDRISVIDSNFAICKFHDLWGLVEYDNKVFPTFEYENKFCFIQDYARVCKKGKWGMIDTKGKVIIMPTNENVGESFFCGLVRVKQKGMWGYKNCDDNYVIPNIYPDASNFHFGYAAVKDNRTNKWLYINKNNEPLPITTDGLSISTPYYDVATNFYCAWTEENDTIRLARVTRAGKMGYLRLNYDTACEFTRCEYDTIKYEYTQKGICFYKKNNKYGILCYSDEITKPIYEEIPSKIYNLTNCFNVKINNKKGVLGVEKDEVLSIVPVNYNNVYYLFDNYWKVERDGKYGLYDSDKRKELISCAYDYSIEINKKYKLVKLHRDLKYGVFDLYANKWVGSRLDYTSAYIYYDGEIRLQRKDGNYVTYHASYKQQ